MATRIHKSACPNASKSGHYESMNPQFRPGDRVRIKIDSGVELTGTVVSYISGNLFAVEIEGEQFAFPQNVRARDMRPIDMRPIEDDAPEDGP